MYVSEGLYNWEISVNIQKKDHRQKCGLHRPTRF